MGSNHSGVMTVTTACNGRREAKVDLRLDRGPKADREDVIACAIKMGLSKLKSEGCSLAGVGIRVADAPTGNAVDVSLFATVGK